MAWSRAFQQCIFFYFLDILQKKIYFCKFAIFFADFKSKAQELSNDVSFVIFGHQTWDLEGGGSNYPLPQRILVFKYPSRDKVASFVGPLVINHRLSLGTAD